jgi:hypothetical protein
LLCLGGLVHVGVWLAEGGTAEGLTGPVSWRKPILFGLSAGVTVLSAAWVVGLFRRASRFEVPAAWLLAVAMVVEVGLITMQQWRGVASHFNEATPLDRLIFHAMGWAITVAMVPLAWYALRSFLPGSLDTTPDTALAVRWGFALLVVAAGLGFVITVIGVERQKAGLPPETYGPTGAGVLKFPHGVPMHALQWLPGVAWLAARAGFGVRGRTLAVASAGAGLTCQTLYSLIQTFEGRARLDVTPLTGTLLASAAALLAAPFAAVGLGMLWRLISALRPSDGPSESPATAR